MTRLLHKSPINIKLCGLTREIDIQAAIDLQVNYVGFVFYEGSPRYITPEDAAPLIASLPKQIQAVGLFVNHTAASVIHAATISGVQILQFHGLETASDCEALSYQLNCPYWKALHIAPNTTVDTLLSLYKTYQTAQAVLFDTATPHLPDIWGGTGQAFNWDILVQLKQHLYIKQQQIAQDKSKYPSIILSGGLNIHNVANGISKLYPWAVDVSSGIEAIDTITNKPIKGIKDHQAMRAFVQTVQKISF